MSLLNRKRVKAVIKEHGKQCSQEFLDQLEYVVRDRINRAIRNLPSSAKRLKASELL